MAQHLALMGNNRIGHKYCYACCAERDKADMAKTGRATLYLCHANAERPQARVTNWPGSLEFPVYHLKTSRHNIAMMDCISAIQRVRLIARGMREESKHLNNQPPLAAGKDNTICK